MKGIFAVAVFEMAIAVIIAMILQIVTIILILIDTEILNFRVLAVFFHSNVFLQYDKFHLIELVKPIVW